MSELLLLGAGGLAREVLMTVRASGQYDVLGILDDDPELTDSSLDGAPVLGTIDEALRYGSALLVACCPMGLARELLVSKLAALGIGDSRYATVLDEGLRVPDDGRIGAGSIVLQQATLGPSVALGSHVVVMPGVNLTCDVEARDFATFAAGASLGEGVRVGRAAHVGMNAAVGDRLSVGDYASVGMNAAVFQDVPSNESSVRAPRHCFRAGRSVGI